MKNGKNKSYLSPEIDIVLFEKADIITTSGAGVEGTPDGSWDEN